MAVLAFVLAFVVSPAAIVLGFIARGQIRRTGESGAGLATAGLVLGIVFTVVGMAAAAVIATVVLKAAPTLIAPPPTLTNPAPVPSAPPAALNAAELARALTVRLANQGVQSTGATCPRDLKGIPGQTVRCTVLVSDDQPVDVIVTVTSVDGDSIHYDFRPEARPIARSLLELKVSELIAQRTGTRPYSTSCASDLPPVVGQHVDCSVSTRGETVAVTVTTTGTGGGKTDFSVAQK